MSCRIGPNVELEQGVFGGQPSQRFEETNRLYNPSIDFHFIIFTLYS
jgi:hypothetical protein